MNRTCKVIGCFLFLGAMSSFGENIHSGRENEGQERPVAGSTSDPREEKGDRYFKSFESLEGDKSKNPSFDVGFVMGGGKTNRCGATAIKTKDTGNQTCKAVTAAHCAEELLGQSGQIRTGYSQNPVSVKVDGHPTYKKGGLGPQGGSDQTQTSTTDGASSGGASSGIDLAVLTIESEELCKNVAKVPLCEKKPTSDSRLYMGSSWMGKLMWGHLPKGLSLSDAAIDTIIDGTADEVPMTSTSFGGAGIYSRTSAKTATGEAAITQGDSGSGLFMENESKNEKEKNKNKEQDPLCFAGALSATSNKLPAEPPLPPDFKRDAMYTTIGDGQAKSFIKEKLGN